MSRYSVKTVGKLIFSSIGLLLFLSVPPTQAEDLKSKKDSHRIFTNALVMDEAPLWLKRTRVEKVTAKIQRELEWSIRRIQVIWHTDESEFQAFHKNGSAVLAVARKSENSVHLGPRVNSENFDQVFGHELVHVIIYQKYKTAIPKWLEEGLANHIAKQGKVDYEWLVKQELPKDVTQLNHPFRGSKNDVYVHYMTSQALAEMISRKCSLPTLLQLSLERKLENYLATYCEIKDLDADFQKWVKRKAG